MDNSSAKQLNKGGLRKKLAHHFAANRKETLLALANLRDDSFEYFRRKFVRGITPMPIDDAAIAEFREQLRRLWRGEDRSLIIGMWLQAANDDPLPKWIPCIWPDGTFTAEPSEYIFPVQVAIGAGEWMARMAVCANPACPQPYFLKGRKTQRFCDRPACIAEGQREHKLDWWRRVGAKSRAEKNEKTSKRSRNEKRRK